MNVDDVGAILKQRRARRREALLAHARAARISFRP
jgi:hypothetical protein